MQVLEKKLLISGAGPVGLSLALGLKDAALDITVIDEQQAPNEALLTQDTRMIAVSHRSCAFLHKLGLWPELSAFATAMNTVHVSQKGRFPVVRMEAHRCGVENFGHLIPQGRLILAMQRQLISQKNVCYWSQSRVQTINRTASRMTCNVQRSAVALTQDFDWIIAAEGVDSHLRAQLGVKTFTREYDQVAVIATGTFAKSHNNTAYERFTDAGPLALLPINTHEMAIVLIAARDQAAYWRTASELTFIAEVLARIGGLLGELTVVSKRHVWPLALMVPEQISVDGVTFIGNSAHGLHPIAGQGLNLGLRDSELLIPLFQAGAIPEARALAAYSAARKKDILRVVGATDLLVTVFDQPFGPIKLLRGLGLAGVQYLPFVKKQIAKFGMGY